MIKLTSVGQNYLDENFWLAEATKDTTRRAVQYMAACCGNLMVTDLQYQHFERYKGWLLKTGRAKTTANIYLRAIRPVLNWARRLKLIEADPMAEIKEFKVTPNPIRIYEDWEFERMLRFAPNIRWRGILICARSTGLRRGEILNLTYGNIRGGFVWVEPKRDTADTWAWQPKDREIRKLPLVDQLSEVLVLLQDSFYPFISSPRLRTLRRLKEAKLLKDRHRRCPEENFRRDFVAIQRRAFGRQIGDFHSLRKTCITEMCEVLPEHFVMKLSGHSSTKTLTYYQSARESYYEIARKTASEAIKKGLPVMSSATLEPKNCS